MLGGSKSIATKKGKTFDTLPLRVRANKRAARRLVGVLANNLRMIRALVQVFVYLFIFAVLFLK